MENEVAQINPAVPAGPDCYDFVLGEPGISHGRPGGADQAAAELSPSPASEGETFNGGGSGGVEFEELPTV